MKFGGKVSWLQPFAISFLYSSIRIVYIIHITVEQYCKAFTTSALSAHAGKVISFFDQKQLGFVFFVFFSSNVTTLQSSKQAKTTRGNKQAAGAQGCWALCALFVLLFNLVFLYACTCKEE